MIATNPGTIPDDVATRLERSELHEARVRELMGECSYVPRSEILTGFCVEDTRGAADTEELGPRVEAMLRGPSSRRSISSPRLETPAAFLRSIDVTELCSRWNRTDGWSLRADRAIRRSSSRRYRRRRLVRRIIRLERQHAELMAMTKPSEFIRRHYQRCWEQTINDLCQVARRPWAGELLKRLQVVNPKSNKPTMMDVVANYCHEIEKSRPPKRRARPRKRLRRNRKFTSAKTVARKGIPALG